MDAFLTEYFRHMFKDSGGQGRGGGSKGKGGGGAGLSTSYGWDSGGSGSAGGVRGMQRLDPQDAGPGYRRCCANSSKRFGLLPPRIPPLTPPLPPLPTTH